MTLGGWLLIVCLDWKYWKTAPHSLHTALVFAIVFTFLFLRLASKQKDLKDVQGLLKQMHYLPQAIAAGLSGINALALTYMLRKC